MQPTDPQENRAYLSTKRYIRTGKIGLDRLMEFANTTSTKLDDHAIVFPELYEISIRSTILNSKDLRLYQ
jgi:hypothetical protein